MVEFIPDNHVPFSFESQANQFPRMGTPGLVYERHYVGLFPDHAIVECLLWYRQTSLRNGLLTGILYFYPKGNEYEKVGAVNIFVDPAFQMRGIGRELVTEALRRWPTIDPECQRYSQDGYKFRLAMEGRSEWR